MNAKQLFALPIIVIGVCFWLTSCSSKSLKDQRAQQEIEYVLEPGAQVVVADGVATFTGTFPDEESMREAQETAKGIKSIKSVVNKATIASMAQTAVDSNEPVR
ncbi:BON domain-containing protein [Olivibacter sp. XZL3]|uniref:BON domain-containing protein n=1 Tax=Olivibacter sp. XZL3 TaxID=1735116 RepID=UPI00106676BA|nr:BON domain-containing protein [Olivibacter sp. XZL3]